MSLSKEELEMIEKTAKEQMAWEYYNGIKEENYKLKREIENNKEEISRLHKIIDDWKFTYFKLTGKKKPKGTRDTHKIKDY